MSSWAYECRPADEAIGRLLVACLAVDGMPAGTSIVRVKVGSKWLCAQVDRNHRLEADGMLLREVIASDESDCPECAGDPHPASSDTSAAGSAPPASKEPSSGRQVEAAAMSLHGHRLIVVLVGLDLVNSPGEADMAAADFRLRFGGVDVVLMAQHEDGTPAYHGDAALLELLDGLPLERMPWKPYPIG